MKWYVLQFTTTRFAAVFKHLERLNFSYYCPMATEKYRRPDKQLSYRERLTPLFPGYLFIQADLMKSIRPLSPGFPIPNVL
ncbi:transcription termination/antitermination NusG family protein [Escherichia coli]|uniref:transcription termination/antitermination NusG family protein n=1 Tax=Escherichia coli TaxID=562 RepID=UPI001FCEAE32|nr:transcription termination/antitermination NusG family protein [Escherichia coli]